MLQPLSERGTFFGALSAEVTAFGELCRLLQAEQECLLRTDVDAVLALTDLKSRTVERLSELASERAAFLLARRLPPGAAGMQHWLAAQAGVEGAQLSDTWARLLALAAQARAANQINGSLIATRLSHNQAALAAMQTAARHHSVYGPDGQSDLRVANRELGRA